MQRDKEGEVDAYISAQRVAVWMFGGSDDAEDDEESIEIQLVFAFKFLNPERMVLLGPVEIDPAGAHGRERALHPDRPNIDVRQDHADHEDRHR